MAGMVSWAIPWTPAFSASCQSSIAGAQEEEGEEKEKEEVAVEVEITCRDQDVAHFDTDSGGCWSARLLTRACQLLRTADVASDIIVLLVRASVCRRSAWKVRTARRGCYARFLVCAHNTLSTMGPLRWCRGRGVSSIPSSFCERRSFSVPGSGNFLWAASVRAFFGATSGGAVSGEAALLGRAGPESVGFLLGPASVEASALLEVVSAAEASVEAVASGRGPPAGGASVSFACLTALAILVSGGISR